MKRFPKLQINHIDDTVEYLCKDYRGQISFTLDFNEALDSSQDLPLNIFDNAIAIIFRKLEPEKDVFNYSCIWIEGNALANVFYREDSEVEQNVFIFSVRMDYYVTNDGNTCYLVKPSREKII
jgi:hypothetical protein